ncbi:DUF4326 domain-containing protein [Streptomyces sp. H27-H5]|uniref:DUF4326 domain-containing protein n=1 Tax=Streptomyces sp. H27-H5 TaxID=2996460 RepID=UPI00226ED7E3|nr:DUF4326 domain-containing protein [Streptomyces sp. H27-H5]MCY0959939.1 DUF4326 domain-containing protein [Streptomyces sp. H27-H5]
MPNRIQRKRTKGWRKPDNAVIVSRPSRFGSPSKIATLQEMGYLDPHAAAASFFEQWLRGGRFGWPTEEGDLRREQILTALPSLRGKDLACTCRPDQACHADVLLAWAAMPERELAERVEQVRVRVDFQRVNDGDSPMYGGQS